MCWRLWVGGRYHLWVICAEQRWTQGASAWVCDVLHLPGLVPCLTECFALCKSTEHCGLTSCCEVQHCSGLLGSEELQPKPGSRLQEGEHKGFEVTSPWLRQAEVLENNLCEFRTAALLFSGYRVGGRQNVSNVLRHEWATGHLQRVSIPCYVYLHSLSTPMAERQNVFHLLKYFIRKEDFPPDQTASDCLLYMFKRCFKLLLIIRVKLNFLITVRGRRIKFIKSPHQKC